MLIDVFAIQYTGLSVGKNHITMFGSFLDIRENSEWPRLIWSMLYMFSCLTAVAVCIANFHALQLASLLVDSYAIHVPPTA